MAKIDSLERSKRKSIAIIVTRDGRVIVRAPLHASRALINAFVEQKQDWIDKKIQEAARMAQKSPPRRYAQGETLPYLGNQIPILVVHHASSPLAFVENRFTLRSMARDQAQALFTTWYRKQARIVLEERVRWYADQFQLKYGKIRISSARTRWGSCSSTGTLSFTWRLVMAPVPVIDYVIIHELAHLIEKNHSSRFWAAVASMLPGYAEQRAWLKEHGRELTLE